jgi:hypothetical protein
MHRKNDPVYQDFAPDFHRVSPLCFYANKRKEAMKNGIKDSEYFRLFERKIDFYR